MSSTTVPHNLAHQRWAGHINAAYISHMISDTQNRLIIGYHDGLIKIKTACSEHSFLTQPYKLLSLLTLKNQHIVSNHADGNTYFWRHDLLKPVKKLVTGYVSSFAELPDDTLAIGLENSNIALYDIQQRQPTCFLGTPSLHVGDFLTWLPPNLLLSCRRDTGTLFIWNINTQKRLYCFRTHPNLEKICLLGNDEQIATSHRDGSVFVWNIAEERCIATIPNASYLVQSIAKFKQDYLATGGTDGKIKIWHTASQTCLLVIDVQRPQTQPLSLPTYVNHLTTLSTDQLAYATNHELGILDFKWTTLGNPNIATCFA